MSKFTLMVEDLPDGGMSVEFTADELVDAEHMLSGKKTSGTQGLALLIAEIMVKTGTKSKVFSELLGE